MNFTWTKENETGQHAIGFLMQYSSFFRGISAKALIQSYPQLPKSDFARIVHVNLFLEAEVAQITDGLFHSIYDDITEIVKEREAEIFDKASKPIEFIETQTLLFKKMPAFTLYTHGDFAILRD